MQGLREGAASCLARRGYLLTPCHTPDMVRARQASSTCSRRRPQEVDDGALATADGAPAKADMAPATADGEPATADGAPATADRAPAKADGADAGLPWPARLHLSNGRSYGVDLVVSAIGVDARAAWLPAELERCSDDGGVLVDACATAPFGLAMSRRTSLCP
jgi:hypothetical protein